MNREPESGRAWTYAVAAVALWSTVASAFKITLRHADPWQLLFYAALTASLCLGLMCLPRARRAAFAALSARDVSRLGLLGILNPLAYYLVLFHAYSLLPAQVAQPLNYTWAITLMLLSAPLLGHRITRSDLAATAVCYAGVVLICSGGREFNRAELDPVGVALALGSTLLWSFYWIAKTRDTVEPVVGLFVSFVCGLPFTLAACVLFSSVWPVPPAGIAGAAYVGLFEMGITYVLWLGALRRARSAAHVTTLIFLSPFLSLVLIHYVVGEAIAVTTIYGLVLVVAGLLLQHFAPRVRLARGSGAQD